MKRWLRWENALVLLLVFVPVTLVLEFVMGVHGTPIFVTASLAIIPLAGLVGSSIQIAPITHDGESHWMEGVQLLAVPA